MINTTKTGKRKMMPEIMVVLRLLKNFFIDRQFDDKLSNEINK